MTSWPTAKWVCTCGHPVEDHAEDPVWPCLSCDCDAFKENLEETW